jgi:hypothetical protein
MKFTKNKLRDGEVVWNGRERDRVVSEDGHGGEYEDKFRCRPHLVILIVIRARI